MYNFLLGEYDYDTDIAVQREEAFEQGAYNAMRSSAKAIRQNILSRCEAKGRILACNRSAASLSQAMSEGVIDGGYSSENVDEMLRECDILFICLYPRMRHWTL